MLACGGGGAAVAEKDVNEDKQYLHNLLLLRVLH